MALSRVLRKSSIGSHQQLGNLNVPSKPCLEVPKQTDLENLDQASTQWTCGTGKRLLELAMHAANLDWID